MPQESGWFDRKIIRREPEPQRLAWPRSDMVWLECGHTFTVLHIQPDKPMLCTECALAWRNANIGTPEDSYEEWDL